MANPNKAGRTNRKAALVAEKGFYDEAEAEAFRDQAKKDRPDRRVRLTSVRVGPRTGTARMYFVRQYESE